MKSIGLEPGPKYQEVKNNETFEYNGKIYDSSQFKGDEKQGPVAAIFGDTMPCNNELLIARNANVMVHESTYIEGDKNLANNYHHSHIDDVFDLIKEANVEYSLITHISNRYTQEEVESISELLKTKSDTPPFKFVKDFDTWSF